mgnify:CR=1 FL=1
MKPINYKALGAKIKEYRKKENITQEQPRWQIFH